MYITDKLVYLELQKTGGTHILGLLDKYVGGESRGKHNRLVDAEGRYVLGSIRNPWDWYVSLWAYGCGGEGAIRQRVTTGFDLNYYNNILPRQIGRRYLNPVQYLTMCLHDARKPVSAWERSYADHEKPELFRLWLRMLLDPARSHDIGEGFAFSPLSRHAGLLTYRYFRLYAPGDALYRDRSLRAYSGMSGFDEQYNCSDFVIRTDRLVQDFIEAMRFTGTALTDEQAESIRNSSRKRTNASKRNTAAYYYDDQAIALVAERDRYLIGKYGFTAPDTAGSGTG